MKIDIRNILQLQAIMREIGFGEVVISYAEPLCIGKPVEIKLYWENREKEQQVEGYVHNGYIHLYASTFNGDEIDIEKEIIDIGE